MISKAPQTLLEFYAERVQHEESGLSASTIKCRRESIKRFSGFLDREALISDLSAAVLIDCHEWLTAHGHAPRSIVTTISCLRTLWRNANAKGLTANVPPAPYTSLRPDKRAARKSKPKRVFAPFKLPDGHAPTLTVESPLIDVFWHFAYGRLEGKHPKTAEHYRGAVKRFANSLGREPSMVDLTDDNLDVLSDSLGTSGFSPYTIDNTRWMLRSLWRHAHQEGAKDDLPGGPRRPVNEPPSPIVEDISDALAIHKASLERDQRAEAKQVETPRQVLSSIGSALKRIFAPPAPPPPVVIAPPPGPDRDPASLTIAELLAAWRVFARVQYPDPWGEFSNVECAIRPLETFYSAELVVNFGPKKLKAVRELMVEGYKADGKHYRGLSRKYANAQTMRLTRVFKWAVSEELAPASLAHALGSVAGLKRGRTIAPERPPIGPVDEGVVEATLPHVSAVVAAMIRLQLLAGCRPGEVCKVRPCDVDRSGEVWQYRPATHKTQHHGKSRVIYFGPQAQEVLRPYLERDPESFCFSGRESKLWWHAKRRLERKTAVQPSQLDRRKPGALRPGKGFDRLSYSKAVAKACKRHGIPHWHPNQLRHTAATKVREQFGLEAAQVILGHSRADVTQVYAERNTAAGLDVMGKIG
jgi:integrase